MSFNEGILRQELAEQMHQAPTMLMAHFVFNVDHPEARSHLCQDFPAHFVYVPKDRGWKTRERGFAISRIYHCNPLQGEKFYLRLLLTIVPGSTSFEDLRTVDGLVHLTF